ncbi:unnamed protein product [Nesidiocoris tenuis]|uniref:Uncharacterized protein n=1 Tax=Nesidiocoris tenuis TaxID=355587 RepID=A0A6H5FVJ9_9HEMI|nr:unnamed protein product [Nesidiocoris tenuis]
MGRTSFRRRYTPAWSDTCPCSTRQPSTAPSVKILSKQVLEAGLVTSVVPIDNEKDLKRATKKSLSLVSPRRSMLKSPPINIVFLSQAAPSGSLSKASKKSPTPDPGGR